MKLAVPKEVAVNETRVALDPERVRRLVSDGFEVMVQTGAGQGAFFSDQAYHDAGASLVDDLKALFGEADVILKVNKPDLNDHLDGHEIDFINPEATVLGFLFPLSDPDLVKRLLDRKLTSFSMDLVPRIARAQKMDALSSMSSLAGYKAALIAADSLGKYFPMLITAAGTIAPSKALILGAGVAGLQAIATARRLGAMVSAYDIRPVVKEQVESLGATFLEVDLGESTEDEGGYAKALSEDAKLKGQQLVHEHIKNMDVVITTALIPGKPAPLLVTEQMVLDMKPGSVIVDLASESGGNCALTEPGQTVEKHGVKIHGPLNVPGMIPIHASQLYARNIVALFDHLIQDGTLDFDFEDEITRDSCATHQGAVVNSRLKGLMQPEA